MPEVLSPDAQQVLSAEDAADAIADLRQRILTGDLGDLDEAAEFLDEVLTDSLEESADEDVVAELVDHLWRDCLTTAEAWAEEQTDADRLLAAFEKLVDKGISCGLFTDWPSLELEAADRGGVLVWVNAWEDLSHAETQPLLIGYTGHSAPDEEVAADLIAALVDQGLAPGEPEDGFVRVPVLWRWHVEDPAEL